MTNADADDAANARRNVTNAAFMMLYYCPIRRLSSASSNTTLYYQYEREKDLSLPFTLFWIFFFWISCVGVPISYLIGILYVTHLKHPSTFNIPCFLLVV